MRIHKQTVLYSTMLLTFSSVTIQILGFIYRIALSRLAGAEGMGVFQLVMPAYSIIYAFTLSGITMSVSRLASESYAMGNHATIKKLVAISMFIFILLFVAIAVPYVLLLDFIAKDLLGDIRTKTALLLILPCLLLTGIENVFKACFYGIKKVKPPIISEILEQTIRIVTVIILLSTFKSENPGVSAALIMLGMVISEVFSSSILGAFYFKLKPHGKSDVNNLWRKIITLALPVAAAGLINNIINSANSILIPRRLIDAGMDSQVAMGSFGVMFGMTLPLLAMPCAFIFPLTTILVPKLAEKAILRDNSDLKRKIAKALHVTGLMAFPSMAMLIPLGGTIAEIIYKQPSAGDYILPLCIATLFSFYHIISSSILNGIGLQKRNAICIVAMGIVELIMIWFSVPYFGMGGFVFAYLFTTAGGAIINIVWIIRKTKMSFRWSNWIVNPFLASMLAYFTTSFIFNKFASLDINIMLNVITSFVAGILVYTVGIRIAGVSITRYLKTVIEEC